MFPFSRGHEGCAGRHRSSGLGRVDPVRGDGAMMESDLARGRAVQLAADLAGRDRDRGGRNRPVTAEITPTYTDGHRAPTIRAPPARADDDGATGKEARNRAAMSSPQERRYGDDIYTEPDGDPDTLSNLGPLTPLAGIWEGTGGADEHPVAEGTEQNAFVERYELQPIDRQTNGPQLFYGLRYHTHIVKPGEVETFHDQVGYWLWEPATNTIVLTLGIPRDRCCWPEAPPNRTPPSSRCGPRSAPRSSASSPTPSSTRPSARSATGCT